MAWTMSWAAVRAQGRWEADAAAPQLWQAASSLMGKAIEH